MPWSHAPGRTIPWRMIPCRSIPCRSIHGRIQGTQNAPATFRTIGPQLVDGSIIMGRCPHQFSRKAHAVCSPFFTGRRSRLLLGFRQWNDHRTGPERWRYGSAHGCEFCQRRPAHFCTDLQRKRMPRAREQEWRQPGLLDSGHQQCRTAVRRPHHHSRECPRESPGGQIGVESRIRDSHAGWTRSLVLSPDPDHRCMDRRRCAQQLSTIQESNVAGG